jgi:hypothetical protein
MAAGTEIGEFAQVDVALELGDLPQALAEVDPKLRRDFEKHLRTRLRVVAGAAGAKVSSRATTSRGGGTADAYRVATRRNLFQIKNRTVGAALLEFAGKVNPQGKTPQGAALIRTLQERYGPPGRIAWATWDAQRGDVVRDLRVIVADAERELEQAGA